VAGDDYIKSNELPRVIKECLEDADLEEETEGEIRGIGPTPAMLGMATNQDAEVRIVNPCSVKTVGQK
jgi:hypothetical protein